MQTTQMSSNHSNKQNTTMPVVVSHAPYRYIPVVYDPSVYQHGSSNSSSTPATPKILIYCFIGFFALVSVFTLWCVGCFSSHRNQCRHNTTTTRSTPTTSTLTITTSTSNNNNNVKRALPVFVYSEKAMEKLECVVCLAEFKDGEKGRILTQCNHRFHMSCIDKWLNSHSSCPICRANPASIISSELPV